MSDTPRIETPPSTRRQKWRVLVAFALLALLALAAVVAWQVSPKDLSDEERHLVGAWTLQLDGEPMRVVLRYEFRPDRTLRVLNLHPETGAVLADSSGRTWRLSGGELVIRRPGAAAGPSWLLPSRRSVNEVFTLTPDGPDRLRYTAAVEVRSAPKGPPVTGTMSRLTPAEYQVATVRKK